MRDIRLLDANRCMLVIVDLQKGYCQPGSDASQRLGWDVSQSDQVCRRHVDFLEAVRAILPPERILWLKMEESDTFAPHAAYGPPLKLFPGSGENFVPLCVQGTPGHDFHLVAPAHKEDVFLKFHPSGFTNREFRSRVLSLKDSGINQFVCTGVVGSRCVNATVLAASIEGFECVVIEDLVAGPAQLADELRHHQNVTSLFYAQYVNSAELLRRLVERDSSKN